MTTATAPHKCQTCLGYGMWVLREPVAQFRLRAAWHSLVQRLNATVRLAPAPCQRRGWSWVLVNGHQRHQI